MSAEAKPKAVPEPVATEFGPLAEEFQRVSFVVNQSDVRSDPVDDLRTVVRVARLAVPFDALVVAYRLSEDSFALRAVIRDEEVTYFADEAAMPAARGGWIAQVLARRTPRLWRVELEESDPALPLVPWLGEMCWAFSVPTQSIHGGESASIQLIRSPQPYNTELQRLSVIVVNLSTALMQMAVLRRRVADAYAALDAEFEVVANIQRQLLPIELPQIPGYALAVHYATSERAGGDYYDFFSLADGQVGILMADVSGHGAPAAVVMAMTRVIMHTYPGQVRPPADVLERVNRVLCSQIRSGQFVTALYGILNPQKHTLAYASAGHPPPRHWRHRRRQVVELESVPGFPLGMIEHSSFAQNQISLEPGDVLVWFTDGVTEVFNADRQMYGTQGLDRALAEHAHGSAEETLERLLRSVEEFAGPSVVRDDQTLLVMKVD